MSMPLRGYFHGEEIAHAKLESLVWPTGAVCPHCLCRDHVGSASGPARIALWRCCRCRKQFRATLGTIFEGGHVPLRKWLQACFLRTGCEYAVGADELSLTLQLGPDTTLAMMRRLEDALRSVNMGVTRAAVPAFGWPGCAVAGASGRRSGEPAWRWSAAAVPQQSEAFVALACRLQPLRDEAVFDRILAQLIHRAGPRALH